jgi:hypothetical protein
VRLGPRGSFAAGTFTSSRLTGPGLPALDAAGAAASMVSALSRADFGKSGVRVRANGELATIG